MHPPAVACCRCRCHVSMSMVILHGAGSVAVCCSGCSHSFSLAISELPAIMHKPCTCSVVLFLLLLLGGSSMMTSTHWHTRSAPLPASLPAALCIDPYLAKRIISHPTTARDTRLDPTSGIPSSECAPQGARGRPPCCRASIRPPPGLGPGLVGHFKRQSKLRHRSRNTTACFRSLRPGPFSKGGAAPTLAPAPYSILSTQQPSRAPGLFFETAAVGWLMSWPVGRSHLAFCLSRGLKLVGG